MSATETDIEIPDGSHGRLVVRRWEPGSAPDKIVLLVHGYGEHGGRYGHVAAHFAGGGAVVYAPDHYGHGRSEGDRAVVTDLDAMAADVGLVHAIAVDEFPGLPVVLIGHSMGGIIATRFAQIGVAELSALVLSAPVIGGNPDMFGLLDMDPMPEIPLDPAALSRDPAVGEAYAADDLVYHGPFSRETLTSFKDAVQTIADGPGFGSLPTLWIHGEHDPLAPYDVTRGATGNVKGDVFEERLYPGAMHEIFNETNQDEVLADVDAFLARVRVAP